MGANLHLPVEMYRRRSTRLRDCGQALWAVRRQELLTTVLLVALAARVEVVAQAGATRARA